MDRSRRAAKRSEHELMRLVERAVVDVFDPAKKGLSFLVDAVEASGRPPERLKVWATLHFLPSGSPFCCGEPICHLGLFDTGRLSEVSEHVQRAMGLRHEVVLDFGNRIATQYHAGVEFQHCQSNKRVQPTAGGRG